MLMMLMMLEMLEMLEMLNSTEAAIRRQGITNCTSPDSNQ